MVMDEAFVCLFRAKVFQRVSPEQIAHKPVCWWLPEAIDLPCITRFRHCQCTNPNTRTYVSQVVQRLQLGRETAMDAEKLLVHDGAQGKGAK